MREPGRGGASTEISVLLFTLYLLAGMGKLLRPRVVAAIVARLDAGRPDEPLPAA